MKQKSKWIAGALALLLTLSCSPTVQAGGIGSFIKKIPGISTNTTGTVKQQKTTRNPERVSNGQQMVTNDLRISTMVKGKLLLHGAPAKEYTTIYVCPNTVTLKGNVFVGGFYGKAVTDTKGEFYVRAQPGTYKLYVAMGETWGVFTDVSTVDASESGATYEVKDFGFKPAWLFSE